MNMIGLLIILCVLAFWYIRSQTPKETIHRYGTVVRMVKGEWKKFPDFSIKLVEKVEILNAQSDILTYRFEVNDGKTISGVSWPSVARDASLPKFEANEIIFVLEMEYSYVIKCALAEDELVITKRSTDAYQQKKYGT